MAPSYGLGSLDNDRVATLLKAILSRSDVVETLLSTVPELEGIFVPLELDSPAPANRDAAPRPSGETEPPAIIATCPSGPASPSDLASPTCSGKITTCPSGTAAVTANQPAHAAVNPASPSAPLESASTPTNVNVDDESSMEVVDSSESDSDGFTEVKPKRKTKRARPVSDDDVSNESKTVKVGTKPGGARAPGPGSNRKPPPPKPAPSNKKEPTPPPIILQDKTRWTEISAAMSVAKIAFEKASTTAHGIRVQVPTSADHRALTSLLKHRNVYFHTYALEEEKKLRVIVRGLPKEISSDAILEDLKSQGVAAEKVFRLSSPRNGKIYDMVHVTLEKSDAGKAIFNLRSICCLSGLRFEPPKKTGLPGQCHNCQLYGHSASNCHGKPRCVKCLGDHGTAACTRPRKSEVTEGCEPPSCVLCGEHGHPANYRGCKCAPRTTGKVQQRSGTRAAPKPSATKETRKVPSTTEFPSLRPVAWSMPPSIAPPPIPRVAPTQGAPPPPPTRAPQPQPPLSSGPPSDIEGALKLVASFTANIDFAEILKFAEFIRSNEGNGHALLQGAIRFAPTIAAFSNFKCNP